MSNGVTPTQAAGAVQLEDSRRAEIFAVIILVGFCLLVPTNGIGSNMMVCSFLYLVYREGELRLRWWQLLGKLLLVTVPYLFLLGFFAFSPRHGLKSGWSTLNGLFLGYLGFYLASVTAARLQRAMQVSVLLLAAIALGLLFYNIERFGLSQVLSLGGLETTVNRNRTGVGLGFSFMLAVVAFISGRDWRARSLMLVSALLLAVVAFLNNSRGALMGMAAAALVVGLLWNWRVTVPAAIAVGLLGAFLLMHHGAHAAAELDHQGSIDNGRFAIWSIVWERVKEQPWLGYGLHAMPSDPVLNAKYPALMQGHPHSIYLELLYASGIVGALFWLLWYIRVGVVVRRGFVAQNEAGRYLGLAWLIYTLVHGAVDFEFYGLLVPSVMVCGIALLVMRRELASASAGAA